MERIEFKERADWQQIAERESFPIYRMDGEPYWDETHAYKFSLAEIEENIEAPTNELVEMCYTVVDHVIENPELMHKLAIPSGYHDAIRKSWNDQDRDIYGRFDFSYDGTTAKLLEFNADTPTSLYEAAVFQWMWLQDKIKSGELPPHADQFNSIDDRLIKTFERLDIHHNEDIFHFAAVLDADEDKMTVGYLADCAYRAGYSVHIMDIADIGVSPDSGRFIDLDNNEIYNLFKLYPLEHMMRESYHLIGTKTRVHEPLWKSILSNKGMLPILWKLYPDHPNLLPAYFADEMVFGQMKDYVMKPLLSREGANVSIVTNGVVDLKTEGEYGEEGYVIQQACILPKFKDDYVLLGSWVVAGEAAGMGIREDKSLVTGNGSRFIPHFIG